MREITIRYNKPETLQVIKSLAKYLDFEIYSDTSERPSSIDDILIPGDKTLNITDLEDVFTGSGIDSKKFRKRAWKRTK